MSCNSTNSNVNKTFIIEPFKLTGTSPTFSACTTLYTNLIKSCSGDTAIFLRTGLISFSGSVDGIDSLTANTIEATTYLSGGTNILDIINSSDTFVTGGTFNDIGDSLSLIRNDGANIIITGLTNFYTTGGTYNNNTGLITFDRNDQLSAFTVDLSSIDINDTFITGTTLSGNILTLKRNDNVDLATDLTSIVFSGGSTNCISDLYVSNLYGCSPITIHDNLQTTGSTASGIYSIALGNNVLASADNSIAVNFETSATSIFSFAKGYRTLSTGAAASSEGANSEARGSASHAEGQQTLASGSASHSQGFNTIASGDESHAEGTSSVAGGQSSHSQNALTVASGAYSHAGGSGTFNSLVVASGITSFAHFNVTGVTNLGVYGNYSAILGGINNNINSGASSSIILGGNLNVINSNVERSVILGGESITATSSDTVFVSNININDTPSNNNSLTEILGRNSITGQLEYRDASTISGDVDTNTFVTGGTFNNSTDIISLNRNDAVSVLITGVTDTFVTGVTFNNTNYQLTTSRNDSINFVTDLSILSSDIKVTGGTYNINTGVVVFRNNSGGTFNVTGFTSGMTDSYTTTAKTSGTLIQFDSNLNGPNFYSVDLTPIISGKTDVTLFDSHTGNTSNPHNVTLIQLSGVSETLFNAYTGNTQIILDNKVENGLNVGGANEIFSGKSGTTLIFNTISGGSNTTITQVGDIQRIDVAVPPSENTFVTGGTYNPNTDIITFNNNSGDTFNVTGVTDTFVSGTTFTSNEGTLTRNDGSEIFKLSGGTNVTLSNPSSNQIKIDVTIPTDTNTFVTGGTYSDSTNIITLDRNDAVSLNITGLTNSYVTGGTVSISATDDTNSGTIGLFYKDSDGIPRTLPFQDTFTSGGTYNNGTKLITFDRNDGNNYNISLSSISTTNTYVTGFTYNDANTFTLQRNEGEPDLTATINSVTGFTVNGNLVVTGNTNIKGLTGTSALLSADTDTILTLIGSGSTNPIFKIEGSTGELFTVTDNLLGSLFTVNNISGLPIFEVFSDDRILMGSYLAPSLNTTVRTNATSGTTNIYSIPTSGYTGAFFDYTLVGNGGARSGNIMSIWSGTTTEFNEVTTNDIGNNTNDVTFNVSISGSSAILAVSVVTGTYTIKTIVRSI